MSKTSKIFAGEEYVPYPFIFPALAAHQTQAKQVMKAVVQRAAKAIQVEGI